MSKSLQKGLLLAILLFLYGSISPSKTYAALKGTYTIDASKSATSTNYKSFDAAVGDLVSGSRSDGGTANGSGVSGAVVFRVANGNYNEQISIGAVTSASATNNITFLSDKGDSSKVWLYYASSTGSSNDYVLQFNGAQYITFKQMTIARTGSNAYATVVRLLGSAYNNTLVGNHIIGQYGASTSSIGFQTAQNACVASTGTDTGNVIMGNRITYGYNAIYVTGSGQGNKAINNIIDSCGSAGMYYLSQSSGLVISGNVVNLGVFPSSMGHYVSYGLRLESSSYYRVVKNKFYSLSIASVSRCIVLFNNTSSSNKPGIVDNNFAVVSGGTTSSTGMATGGNSYLDFYYNSILMTATTSGSAAFYVYTSASGQSAGSYINIVNNNLIHKGGGYAFYAYSNQTGIANTNYNNLYSSGSYIGNWSTTDCSDLSAWKSASSFDGNSISGDPGFVSTYDLHASSSFLNNKGTSYSLVTDDIDGDKRSSSTPDIGADEFTPVALDAGVSSLDSPAYFCAGLKNLNIKITNYGANTLTKATIAWTVNGTAQTSYSWTGSLASGATSTSFTIGKFNFSSNVRYNVKIWTTAPNGGTDGSNSNDTLRSVKTTGVSGTFTIGGTTPDYKSINDALIDVTARGICGATTLKIRNGIYPEQLTVPQFVGTSTTNTVTFTSENKDSTKVHIALASASANGVNNSVIQFNGADNVIFDKISIERTGTSTFNNVIEIKGGANNNVLQNCRIVGISTTSANANNDIVVSTADRDTGNTFRNNAFKFGNYSINMTGDTMAHDNNTILDHNLFDSSYAGWVKFQYTDNLNIQNNTFQNLGPSSNPSTGIYLLNDYQRLNLQKNRIFMTNGGPSALTISYCTFSSSAPGLVANNFITTQPNGAVSNPNGMIVSGTSYLNVYHNSISITGSSSGSTCFNSISASGANVNLLNNIFSNAAGGYCLTVNNKTPIASSNYNDLYTTGTNLASWATKDYTTINALNSASSNDKNSVTIYPSFVSTSDLHVKNLALNGKGSPTTSVTTDIDGQKRDTKKPDIGADEFSSPKAEAGTVGITVPGTSVCAGTYKVTTILKNYGSDTLRSATLNWSVDGSVQTAYKWTGKLAPDSSASISVGSFAFTTVTVYNLVVWSSLPNGVKDSFTANDSSALTIGATANPLAVTGTAKTICSGTSVTLGAGTTVIGNTYKWKSTPSGFSASTSNITVTPTATTTYALTEITSSGCTKSDSVKITVTPSPTISVGNAQSVCAGATVSLGSAAISGNSYAWVSKPAGFTSTTANPSVNPTVTTKYILTVTNTSSLCTKTDSVIITVNPLPLAKTGASRSVCAGTSVTLGTSSSGNKYSWTSKPTGFTSSVSNPTFTPTATATYYLTETISATSCSKSDSITITVNPQPKAKIVGKNNVCSIITNGYKATKTTGDIYSWSITGGTITAGAGTDTISVVWNNVTKGVLKLNQSNKAGCSDTTSYNISINTGTKAKFGAKTVCFGSPTNFLDSSVNPTKYIYYFGDGDTSSKAKPSHTYKAPGTYTVKLKVLSPAGCFDSTVRTALVDSIPVASFVAPTVCLNDVTNFVSNTIGPYTYYWEFGDGNFINGNNFTTTHTYTQSGTFTTTLAIFNKNGCRDSVRQKVVVRPLPDAHFFFSQIKGLNWSFKAMDTTQVSYSWDFGDGVKGTGFKTTYKYSKDGDYDVRLRVTAPNTCQGVFDSLIKIRAVGINEPYQAISSLNVYPNPFNDITYINYTLLRPVHQVALSVSDVTGREISKVYLGSQFSGPNTIPLNASNTMKPGIYIISLILDDSIINKRVVKTE